MNSVQANRPQRVATALQHARRIIVTGAIFLLAACSIPVKLDAGNPVAVAACPASLPPLTDDTFGATVAKLVEVAGIYHKCRAAAVGER